MAAQETWTRNEEMMLTDMYPYFSNERLSEMFDKRTTKAISNKGLGLGLAKVRNQIRQVRGTIRAERDGRVLREKQYRCKISRHDIIAQWHAELTNFEIVIKPIV